MLPTGKKDRKTAFQITFYTLWMILISLIPYTHYSGSLRLTQNSALVILILGILMLFFTVTLFGQRRIEVKINKNSVFEDIFGSNKVMVNSLHGQGIKEPGVRVIIDGYANDGTPEALSIKDSIGFCLAVQWHPEWNASCDNVSKPLFQNFGKNLRLPSN